MTLRYVPFAFASLALLATAAVAAPKGKSPVVEAPSGNYVIDLTHASIIWKVSHMGLSKYPARFVKFDGSLAFDATKPENSKLVVNIDPTSIRTEFPDKATKDFDAELSTSKDWFNSVAFPQITFVSKSVTRTGSSTANILGDLTFLGVTKPVTLKATYNGSMKKHMFTGQPMLGFSATGKLKRSDFGFSKYLPMIGDEVSLDIEAEFTQPK
jgi:polyisoprenoid-binding protein YceI